MTHAEVAPILMLVSGFCHAVVNAIHKAGKDKMSSRALIDGFSAILIAPVIFFVPLPAHAWGWLFASWLIHLIYLVSLVKAFETLDMSVAYPIARGLAPVLAAAGAVLVFHDPITVAIAAGILCVSGGVVAIGFQPHVDRRALGWAALTGLSTAAYTVVDAQGVRAAPIGLSYIAWIFLIDGLGIAAVFALWRGRNFLVAAAAQWRPGLAAGALSIVTYGLALQALRWGAVPRLAALRETSILFATVIAVLFLGERVSLRRGFGVALVAAGAIWLLAEG